MICVIWASNTIVSKLVVAHMGVPPLFYAAARFAVVALCVFPWLLPMPRPWWRLLAVALLMGGGNFALMFVGLKSAAPSASAVVVQLGAPITTFFGFLLLGERLTLQRATGMVLTLLGAGSVMYDPHGFAVSTGLLYVLAAVTMGSLGAVMMKQMEGVKPLQFQAWVGFASFLPLALLTAILEPGQIAAAEAAGWPFVACLLFSAVVVSVVGHTLYFGLLQRHDANLISPLTLMTPLSTIVLGVAVLHDPFGLRMAIGTAVALIGVLVIVLRPSQVMLWLYNLRNRTP